MEILHPIYGRPVFIEFTLEIEFPGLNVRSARHFKEWLDRQGFEAAPLHPVPNVPEKYLFKVRPVKQTVNRLTGGLVEPTCFVTLRDVNMHDIALSELKGKVYVDGVGRKQTLHPRAVADALYGMYRDITEVVAEKHGMRLVSAETEDEHKAEAEALRSKIKAAQTKNNALANELKDKEEELVESKKTIETKDEELRSIRAELEQVRNELRGVREKVSRHQGASYTSLLRAKRGQVPRK